MIREISVLEAKKCEVWGFLGLFFFFFNLLISLFLPSYQF